MTRPTLAEPPVSRVLLFVQTGDARLKVFKKFARAWRDDPNFLEQASDYAGAVKCDRWWLVECANAEAGRAIITHDFLCRTSIGGAFRNQSPIVKSRDPHKLSEPVVGRVLASVSWTVSRAYVIPGRNS